MAYRSGSNASKQIAWQGAPPWVDWPEQDRAERASRWIRTYCRLPKGYGAGGPLRLAEFQETWLRDVLADGVNSAAMEVARGNGKSTLLAALALWALFDESMSGAPQVPIVATTLNQAIRSVYGVAVDMIGLEPELTNRVAVFSGMGTQRVRFPFNGGEMFPVSSDPDGLQGLDPSLAVCDEIGFIPIESWDSLLLASGKRPQSLVVGIGTPGFDRLSTLWHLRHRSRSGMELPGFRFVEYAAPEDCSIFDEASWYAANPALGEGFMNIDALRTAVVLSPESHFRIFRLGQWVDGVESWLGADGRRLWQSLEDPWEMEAGGDTWVGIDVALKHDSTAIVWCQRRPDGRYHMKAKIWLPREDGRLDVSDAMQFVRDLGAMYHLRAVAYDPRFFDLPAQQLADESYPILEFPQSQERMTPAAGAVFEAIKRSEIAHDGDEAFETQVLNAVARFNERGFMLAKSKSKDRIDSAVAMCMAYAVAQQPVAVPTTIAGPLTDLAQPSYWRT